MSFTIFSCYKEYKNNPIEFENIIKDIVAIYPYMSEWRDAFKAIDKCLFIIKEACDSMSIESLNMSEAEPSAYIYLPNKAYVTFFIDCSQTKRELWQHMQPQVNLYTMEIILNQHRMHYDIRTFSLSEFFNFILCHYIPPNSMSGSMLREQIANMKSTKKRKVIVL